MAGIRVEGKEEEEEEAEEEMEVEVEVEVEVEGKGNIEAVVDTYDGNEEGDEEAKARFCCWRSLMRWRVLLVCTFGAALVTPLATTPAVYELP